MDYRINKKNRTSFLRKNLPDSDEYREKKCGIKFKILADAPLYTAPENLTVTVIKNEEEAGNFKNTKF